MQTQGVAATGHSYIVYNREIQSWLTGSFCDFHQVSRYVSYRDSSIAIRIVSWGYRIVTPLVVMPYWTCIFANRSYYTNTHYIVWIIVKWKVAIHLTIWGGKTSRFNSTSILLWLIRSKSLCGTAEQSYMFLFPARLRAVDTYDQPTKNGW